jgi:hypothetical protein
MNEVYIVAGGPSLADFDWRSLDDKHVITINNAAFKLPNAKYVYFCNRDWFEKWKYELRAHKGIVIQGSVPTDSNNVVHELWVERWAFVDGFGLTTKHGCLIPGGNSGYAAINLAVQLGYKKIYLLGYDMKHDGDRANYHDDHLWHSSKESFPGWLRRFEDLVQPLKDLGIQVVNLTPNSDLKVFPVT